MKQMPAMRCAMVDSCQLRIWLVGYCRRNWFSTANKHPQLIDVVRREQHIDAVRVAWITLDDQVLFTRN
ncbi:hypothetical protein [Xanthomonas sp. MUS 060]|uniref:hypothetical protein n=1 Tax=Xanthomonas sp. MUS 060 TaxID=1588031 RepID=UPI000698E646|nr:hypothetical protein [Xanthomonas sp. MUS 060]